MRIRWLGHATFLLTGEANTVAIDPYGEFPEDRRIKFDYPSLEGIEADVVLVTHEHMDHNAVDVIGGDPEVLRARNTGRASPPPPPPPAPPAGGVVVVKSRAITSATICCDAGSLIPPQSPNR